jgi:hypothetical protein
MKTEKTNTDIREFNGYNFIENLDDFVVFRNEIEIHYHLAGKEGQVGFLQLNIFNSHTKNNSLVFDQLQFGYQFSNGIN